MERVTPRKQSTILQTAIPPKRGPAVHKESDGDLACTEFDARGFVKSITTPADGFRRAHEVMHANHTGHFDYPTINNHVKQIVEDCRLHLKFWPWKDTTTPQVIVDDTVTVVSDDVTGLTKKIAETKHEKASSERKLARAWAEFACSIRAKAIARGIGPQGSVVPQYEVGAEQEHMAEMALDLISKDRQHEAAVLLEATFFPKKVESEEEKKKREKSYENDYEEVEVKAKERSAADEARHKEELKAIEKALHELRDGEDGTPYDKRMKIIELPCTEPTSHMTGGFRMATSGPRIYRPALRKPVLPQRIFFKRSPVAPQGTILFDSSGSMSVNDVMLQDCCLRAPTATIGYYFGFGGPTGKLIIYARDGLRSAVIHPVEAGGNGVDGPALEWLMQQEGPRIFVTDRGFCDAGDSMLAKTRLEHLEAIGEVEVIPSFARFQEIYPKIDMH